MSALLPLAEDERAHAAGRLARLGGQMARALFRQAVVSFKDDGSMVTDADLRIQRRVQGEIGRLFPEDGVLGEEATGDERRALEARYCWVLDPIDGTNNFGRRLPGFAVSIGILRDGAPFAGAVYDPIADWLFAARRGVGAWLNGEALTATPSPLSSRSLFAMRAPFEDGVPAFVEAWLRRYRLRRFGSTALHLCYVAFGGLAFAHDHRASLWDIAGAASVLLEAGGVLTRPDGSSVFPFDPARIDEPIGLVAANTEAHHTVLADIERELASSAR